MKDQATRHAKFGNSVYMQEPNVKSGCGGLRDYQNLLWMTYFKEGALTTTHLVGSDWLSETEQRRLDAAYDFLLRVRTALHYETKRATDVLHLNIQEQLAHRLQYSQTNGTAAQRSVHEGLLRAHAQHFPHHRADHGAIRERTVLRNVARRFSVFCPETAQQGSKTSANSLVARNSCTRSNQNLFRQNPTLMMRAFQLAQDENLELSPELEDLFARNLSLVTRTFQYAKEPRDIFRAILTRKGEVGRVLRMMHRVDFLGRYIPEFGAAHLPGAA